MPLLLQKRLQERLSVSYNQITEARATGPSHERLSRFHYRYAGIPDENIQLTENNTGYLLLAVRFGERQMRYERLEDQTQKNEISYAFFEENQKLGEFYCRKVKDRGYEILSINLKEEYCDRTRYLAILRFIEYKAYQQKARSIYVSLDDQNRQAVRFFRSAGFYQIDRKSVRNNYGVENHQIVLQYNLQNGS